jgi:lipoprotein-releasing system permease protein
MKSLKIKNHPVFQMFQYLIHSRWTGWMGFRYLKSKKNSKFLSFITLISIAGISIGVTAMIVVLSVMDGFEVELKKRLMASDLHVLISPKSSAQGFNGGKVLLDSFPKTPEQIKLLSSPEVKSFFPVIQAEAILKAVKVSGVVIKGLPSKELEAFKPKITEAVDWSLRKNLPDGDSARLPGVYIGQELAFEMGILPGDEVTFISPTESDGPFSSIPRMKKFLIEGIYRTGIPEQELHTLFALDSSVRSFLRKSDIVSHWEVVLNDFDRAPQFAKKLEKFDQNFTYQDWIQLNSHLFASLKLERFAMFVSLAFIIIVASFNIITTLTLMVLEKKREISILKAMGAKNHEIGAVFLSEGLFIGGVGIFLGLIFGYGICLSLKKWEFITLPDVYYDRTLPVSFLPQYYILIGISALVIVLIACVYPSQRASQIDPLLGIRYG